MMIDSLSNTYRYGVVALVIGLLLWFLTSVAQGQTLRPEGKVNVSAWSEAHHCYQHSMTAEGRLQGTWGPAIMRARLQVRRWGACDSKIQSAIFNAESGRAYSRRQSVLLGMRLGQKPRTLILGAQVDRRSAHHVWRHRGRENRHPWFPKDWETGRKGCTGKSVPDNPPGASCPALGYWDGVRPYLQVQLHGVELSARGPLLRWKSVTLPWPSVIGELRYQWKRWTVGTWMQTGGPQDEAGIVYLSRELPSDVYIQASFGRRPLPEWKQRHADVLAFTVGLR